MKTLAFFFSVCLLFPAFTFAQLDSAKLEFYPLHIGDLWQYRGQSSTVVWSIKIIGDTVINGIRYYKSANPDYPQNAGIVRVDSLYRVVYPRIGQQGEYNPKYRLNELLGSAYEIPFDVSGVSVMCPGSKYIMKFVAYVEGAVGPGMDAMIFYPGKIDTAQADTCIASEFRFILVKGLGVYREEYEADIYMQLTGAIINGVRWGTIVSVENYPPFYATDFRLEQNYPNPFNPRTTIEFVLPQAVNTTLKVYDILGREVRSLMEDPLPAGHYNVSFDASSLPSGMYIYRLTAGKNTAVKKMTVLK